jgi:UDP-N-acetylmuramate--alanine ligase
VHQPHRYSRLHDLFEEFCACFNDADVVGITEVFAAGEEPIAGADRDSLIAGLVSHGHRRALPVAGEAGLLAFARAECRPGDLLICLGAGSISGWTNALPQALGR